MIVICIPAYKPNQKLIELIEDLENLGHTRIVIVDDGCGHEYTPIFVKAEELGCNVVRHAHNLGKGAALRTGIEKAVSLYGRKIGIVTADADGQHLPRDIVRVADTLEANPDCLVLGVRDFSADNVPARSAFGNRFSAAFFKAVTGIRCSDTQTGLRGIPSSLIEMAIREEGDRYDYEMNFLMDAVKQTGLIMVPIETVYDGDEESHFQTIRDSILVYQRPLKKIGAGLAVGGIIIGTLRFLFTHEHI